MSVKITRYIFEINGALNGAGESASQTALKVAAQAKAFCPRKFGQLTNSIMIKKANNNTALFNDGSGDQLAPAKHKISITPEKGSVFVGTNSDHWYPEFGTRYQAAQPFLRPAIDIVINKKDPDVIKAANEAMKAAFQKKKVVEKNV